MAKKKKVIKPKSEKMLRRLAEESEIKLCEQLENARGTIQEQNAKIVEQHNAIEGQRRAVSDLQAVIANLTKENTEFKKKVSDQAMALGAAVDKMEVTSKTYMIFTKDSSGQWQTMGGDADPHAFYLVNDRLSFYEMCSRITDLQLKTRATDFVGKNYNQLGLLTKFKDSVIKVLKSQMEGK